MGSLYGKFPILFPNPTPIRIPKDMGLVWETYHKGAPENSLEKRAPSCLGYIGDGKTTPLYGDYNKPF